MRDQNIVPVESIKLRQTSDLSAIREKLRRDGPVYWRTLKERQSASAVELLEDEFPSLRGQVSSVDRRQLLKIMGASLAFAGTTACTRQPNELIVPYVRQPENVVPGVPLYYATAMPLGGYARGLLVESHLNRPTKVEGNPDHPASLGATDIFAQASILTLYDPDRSQSVLHEGRLSSWEAFMGDLSAERQNLEIRKGEGLAIVTGATTSPTLIDQIHSLLQQWPAARWYIHEPSCNPAQSAVQRLITGRPSVPVYDLSQAEAIVSLESDFLNTGPGSLAYARSFAKRRAVDQGETPCRLYVMEASPSVTGNLADHRFRVKSSSIASLAYHLARACGAQTPSFPEGAPSWIDAVAKDLLRTKGRSLVIPGEYQPENVVLAAHALNTALGNIGRTVRYVESPEPDQTGSLQNLVNDLNAGRVETLVILGPNPVYTSPVSLLFSEAIRKARLVVKMGLFYDETSTLSHWHIPEAHYLESWSDSRAFNGTATIQQPLIAPMYAGRSAHEVIGILSGRPDVSAHDFVKSFWQKNHKGSDFDTFWQQSLHDGVVANTAAAQVAPVAVPALPALQAADGTQLEIVFRPDPTIGDGDFSNNAWLQELPKPQTKLAWDNTIWLSPKTASQFKVENEDVVQLTADGRNIEGPVWVLPGHADESVTVQLGYGRTSSGSISNNIGYNAYVLQNEHHPFLAKGASISKTGRRYALANTQETQSMEEREPVRAATLAEFRQHPDFPILHEHPLPADLTLYPNFQYQGYKWGMTIDLNVCTGCSACVVACQAENNIPVVGKDQVARGRHMHWLRVDRYYHGDVDDPEVYNQPVPCMHCENAPCEVVCPVAATVHSEDGLNEMVYNRCVGTRYCSNNCPYKVRRFNFYLYSDWQTPSLYGLRNPDVTVRSRGVMEKCTYCVQRIHEAKVESEKQNRRIRDGEILTACQQACPTEAIVFGDLNNPASKVAKLSAQKRKYLLLDELNAKPRTMYLGYVRNPNDSLRGPHENRES